MPLSRPCHSNVLYFLGLLIFCPEPLESFFFVEPRQPHRHVFCFLSPIYITSLPRLSDTVRGRVTRGVGATALDHCVHHKPRASVATSRRSPSLPISARARE